MQRVNNFLVRMKRVKVNSKKKKKKKRRRRRRRRRGGKMEGKVGKDSLLRCSTYAEGKGASMGTHLGHYTYPRVKIGLKI